MLDQNQESATEIIQNYFQKIRLYYEMSSDDYEMYVNYEPLIDLDEKITELKNKFDDTRDLLYASVPSVILIHEIISCIKSDLNRIKPFIMNDHKIFETRNFMIFIVILVILMFLILSKTYIIFLIILFYGILRKNLAVKKYFNRLRLELQIYQEEIQLLQKEKEKLLENYQKQNKKEIDVLEKKVQAILGKNQEQLKERGLSKLCLGESVELEPIISLKGISKNKPTGESHLWKENLDQNDQFSRKKLLIKEEDFWREDRCFDRKTRFSIYEFCSIFITHNLLAYYRCYWNFVRQSAVDEETCVYLYDKIVSVHTHDNRSLNQKDSSIVRSYGGSLTIRTIDGNSLTIEISDDQKRKIDSVKNSPKSKVDRIAEGIREWLKQKQVNI